jgi:hypothetical protein
MSLGKVHSAVHKVPERAPVYRRNSIEGQGNAKDSHGSVWGEGLHGLVNDNCCAKEHQQIQQGKSQGRTDTQPTVELYRNIVVRPRILERVACQERIWLCSNVVSKS